MKATLTLLFAALAVGCSHAPDKPLIRPRSVLLIRHAEKPADAADAGLSPAGKKRADALPELFKKAADRPDPLPTPDFIFATKATKHSNRPVETVTPLAAALHLEVNTSYANDDYSALAEELYTNPKYAGRTLLISWHHGTLPEFATALGATGVPEKWKGSVFDRVWVVTFDDKGKARPLAKRAQALLPGDAKECRRRLLDLFHHAHTPNTPRPTHGLVHLHSVGPVKTVFGRRLVEPPSARPSRLLVGGRAAGVLTQPSPNPDRRHRVRNGRYAHSRSPHADIPMRSLLLCGLVALLAHFSLSADDKKDADAFAKALVGKWALKKDPQTVVELTTDGRMLVKTVINEKPSSMEGKYKLEGKKLTVTVAAGSKEVERVQTIFDLTDTELITSDENGKKTFSVRIKDK